MSLRQTPSGATTRLDRDWFAHDPSQSQQEEEQYLFDILVQPDREPSSIMPIHGTMFADQGGQRMSSSRMRPQSSLTQSHVRGPPRQRSRSRSRSVPPRRQREHADSKGESDEWRMDEMSPRREDGPVDGKKRTESVLAEVGSGSGAVGSLVDDTDLPPPSSSRRSMYAPPPNGSGLSLPLSLEAKQKRYRPKSLDFVDPAAVDLSAQSPAEALTWYRGGGSSSGGGGHGPADMRSSRSLRSSPSSLSSSLGSDPSTRGSDSLPRAIRGPGSDQATSPEASEIGSPTPKPTPAYDGELPGPDYAGTMTPYGQRLTAAAGPGNATMPLPLPSSSSSSSQRHHRHAHRYGTPEMPRGSANLPHLPSTALNPRVPSSGHAKHLPRAEKQPLTGYQLVATKLSSIPQQGSCGRRDSLGAASTNSGDNNNNNESAAAQMEIKPLYRRFETLNHRLLLHLQDELSELEEQLHRLDTADTQTRRLQTRILPASRRGDFLSGGELQWHRTDILGKIGFKLGQYNTVLSSFTETQRLPSPSLSDVESYRTYLSTEKPLAENETRFLDTPEDLVSLAPPHGSHSASSSLPSSPDSLPGSFLESPCENEAEPEPESTGPPPNPLYRRLGGDPALPPGSESLASRFPDPPPRFSLRTMTFQQRPRLKTPSSSSAGKHGSSNAHHSSPPNSSLANTSLPHLNSIAVTIIVPVFASAIVSGAKERMIVAFVVAFVLFGVQVRAGTLRPTVHTAGAKASRSEVIFSAGLFGAAMAVVSLLFFALI